MKWTGDVGRGSWIAARLHGWGTVDSTVPGGFDAYVRIFHPFRASRGEQRNDWTWAELAERTACRDYVLVTTALDELADPTWPYRAGIGWLPDSSPFGGSGPMPQLIWPADQAWCIASEIDFDSTVVGGSRSLIDAILTSGLEALAVPEDGDLSENGDRIDPKPPH